MNPFSAATAADVATRLRARENVKQPSVVAGGSGLQRSGEVFKSHYIRHGSTSAHCTLMVQSNCLLHATDATFCIKLTKVQLLSQPPYKRSHVGGPI